MPYLLEMCPTDLKKAQSDGLPLMIATGSVELHGGQLPLGTDLFITEGVAREIEGRLPVVVAPPIVYCPTGHAVSGPEDGTVDIGVDCFIDHCGQILSNYERMKFRKIYVLVHHQGGNISAFIKTAVLKYSMYEVNGVVGDGWWTKGVSNPMKSAVEIVPAMLDTGFFGGHGGKGETEAVMAFRPETVRLENIEAEPYRWNRSVTEASEENALMQKETLVRKWVEKIRQDMGWQ